MAVNGEQQQDATVSAVLVEDEVLRKSYSHSELRFLKTHFDLMNTGKTGTVTVNELHTGMKMVKTNQTVTNKEVGEIVTRHDTKKQGGLDFEDFLRMQLELRKAGRGFRQSPSKGDSSFLTSTATTLVHTISDSEKKAYVDHINMYLEGDASLQHVLPIDSSTNQLFDMIKDGIILCKLVNVAVPGTIDERAINMKEKLNPWERIENHTLFLNSAKAVGCSVVNIGTEDLTFGRPHLVLGLISQIVKIQLLSTVNLKQTPELAELLDETEEFEELWSMPAEKILLRWMNFHLRKAGHKKTVSNFTTDVRDGSAYALLLHQLAPEHCSLSPLQIDDLLERAKAVLAQADRINCRKYLTPKDLVEGSPNLNLAFVAHLFHTRNGLTQDPSNNDYAELLHDDEYNEASREERMYRAWINSQGCDTFVTSLFEDVRDGWVLLETLDKVSPGSVSWRSTSRPPIKSMFKKVENCNQVVDIGKRLRFSLVNIAGSDIVQGNKKLILAYLWQLIRFSMLQLLKDLRLHGREVSDADIIHWANLKVRNAGKTTRMESFKDKSLSSGLFFLDLLGAVEPRVVNWDLVTNGVTDDDKRVNATYIISVARKLGCSVFLLWDDIVEVRPKMILTLTASIMLWSLANKVITKAADASAAAGKWAAAMQKIDATNKLGKLGNGTVI
jgi:plastin-1